MEVPLMLVVTLAPAEDGGEKTKTAGTGQQVPHYSQTHIHFIQF